MVRVLQVGLGPLGRLLVADMARRGIARVDACVDLAPELGGAGRTLSDVVEGCGFDLPIVPSLADALAGGRKYDVAVVSTSSDLAACADTFRALLAAGIPIVSTCEELLYPWLRHPALADELHALAVKHNTKLLGTGVNPGFLMDTLPLAVTAVCRSVSTVHVWRVQDATPRRVPFQKKIGAGLTDEQFAARVKDGTLRHVGLGESLHFIARYLGFDISKWEESIEPVHAERELNCALGTIRPGLCAGVRQVARGWGRGSAGTGSGDDGGGAVIELIFQAAIGQDDPHDRVLIEGEPPIDLVIRGGVHGDVATSAITLNAIAPLLRASPGLHTMATIPLVCCTPRIAPPPRTQ